MEPDKKSRPLYAHVYTPKRETRGRAPQRSPQGGVAGGADIRGSYEKATSATNQFELGPIAGGKDPSDFQGHPYPGIRSH